MQILNLPPRLFRHLLTRLYFRSIRTSGQKDFPVRTITLFACTHRNGAVDGLIMENVLDNPLGIVGRNLTRSPYLRFFLGGGIAIHRHPQTMIEHRENTQQLQNAALAAVAGRQVMMFPEGTSKLGPSLLPVKKGMAYLARLAVKAASEKTVLIVPVGLHYTRGFSFRSDVEVVFGSPLTVDSSQTKDLDTLTAQIAQSMTKVGVCFLDSEEQRNGELFADTVLYQKPSASHRAACLAYGNGTVNNELRQQFTSSMEDVSRHAMEPILPLNGPAWELIRLLVGAPLILTAFLLNLPICAGAHFVARKMADDDNVITLWRLLAGTPIAGLQITAMLVITACSQALPVTALAGYGLITWGGIKLYHRWRLALAATINFYSSRRRQLLTGNKVVQEWLRQQN